MNRICIYAKDVQVITGKSERQAREIMKQIRQLTRKEKHQPITVHDLCDYLGFEVRNVAPLIK
ncbi:hypothetical protein [Flavobacterium wongokense]|uniref:hypothetical protein n=1 Tax=Flavobacterium wongokense TaxID=2910674 RepID=UPI001F3D521B|nr:hypothetical protein [Flavobacterium sp. WG47]MCF6130896.1 hypothetical protein [Flavobacterium sp. WG47]